MAADPKKIKEIADLLDQIQKQYNKLGEKNPFKGMDPNKVKDVDKEIKRLETSLEGVESKARRIDTTFGDLQGTLESITKEISQKQNSSLNKLTKGMKSLVSEARKLADEEVGINTLSKKQLEKIKERALSSQRAAKDSAASLLEDMKINLKKEGSILKQIKSNKKLTKEQKEQAISAVNILKDKNQIQQDLINKIQDRIGLEDKFNKKLGIGGKLAGGLDKALQKAGLPSIGIADAIEGARENFIKTNGESSVFKDTVKGIGKNLKGALSSANLIQGAFALLVKSVMEVDKASGEFAKNNGISYQNALKLRGEMSQVALHADDIMVNSKELMKTQESLNGFFGSSVKFSGQLASDMTSIARRTNMTAETQGVFALESMKTGKSAKNLLKTQTTQVLEMNKQKGLHMSVKQVQDAIGKTSKALQLTFKGSTKELTNQVMSAKALGASMETVNSIASSILDFEGSIQSELEAELLLGKDINLEKARQFALEGDMGKMADEVLKNKAIMNAFDTKNVIAQEAAAKALGLNRDQLADMVMEQQKITTLQGAFGNQVTDMNSAQEEYNKLRDEGMTAEQAAAKLGDEALANQMESASVAERLEGIMARISEIFITMAEPMLGLVDGIMIMVGGAENLATVLKIIGGLYLGIKATMFVMEILGKKRLLDATVESTLASQQVAAQIAQNSAKVAGNVATSAGIAAETTKAGVMATQAAAATTTNAMSTFGIGTVIAVGAVMAALAALGTYMYMKDGVIGPGGEMVVSGPKGSIQLDKDDSIIAGTDLMGGKGKGGGNQNNSALIAKVDQLISVNQAILAKSPVIEMSGNEVGQGINTAEREIQ
jgi:hypothetical protein